MKTLSTTIQAPKFYKIIVSGSVSSEIFTGASEEDIIAYGQLRWKGQIELQECKPITVPSNIQTLLANKVLAEEAVRQADSQIHLALLSCKQAT